MENSLIDQRKNTLESVMEIPISKLIMCQKLDKLLSLGNFQELDKPDITESNSLGWTNNKRIGWKSL